MTISGQTGRTAQFAQHRVDLVQWREGGSTAKAEL